MKAYSVVIRAQAIGVQNYMVEADSTDEAKQKALEFSHRNPPSMPHWEYSSFEVIDATPVAEVPNSRGRIGRIL